MTTRYVPCKLTTDEVRLLDELVQVGKFCSRADGLRNALYKAARSVPELRELLTAAERSRRLHAPRQHARVVRQSARRVLRERSS